MTTSTFVSSGVPVPGHLLRDVRRLLLLLHSVWTDQSASGVYIGPEAENLFSNLLNVAFDRGFTNLNKLKTNFPAVDLTSMDRKVAVQVTLTLDKKKATKTQKKFLELCVPDGLLSGYDELWVVGLDLSPRRPLKAWEPESNVRWESMSSILQLEDRSPTELQSMIQLLHQFLGTSPSKSPSVEVSIERIVHFMDRRAISEFSDRENDWDECIRVVDAISFLVHNGYKTFSDHQLDPVMWTMPLPDLPRDVQQDLRVILRQLHNFRAEIKATKPRYGEKAPVIDVERLKLQALVNVLAEKYLIPKPFPEQNLVTR